MHLELVQFKEVARLVLYSYWFPIELVSLTIPSWHNTSSILVECTPPPAALLYLAFFAEFPLEFFSRSFNKVSEPPAESDNVCCLNKLWTGTAEPAWFLADIQPEKSSVELLQLRGCFQVSAAAAAAAVLSVPSVQPVVCLSLPRNPSLLPGKVGWGLQPPTMAAAFLCRPGEKRLTSDLSA